MITSEGCVGIGHVHFREDQKNRQSVFLAADANYQSHVILQAAANERLCKVLSGNYGESSAKNALKSV